MTQVIISQLPPLPNEIGSGVVNGTNIYPATDILDTTEATTGTTKKYTVSNLFNFILNGLGYVTYKSCAVASVANLSSVYSNGTAGVGATLTNNSTQTVLTIDGVVLTVGQRVLVAGQSSNVQNGIYSVTTVGSSSSNWVLTRAIDYNMPAQIIQYGIILINQGLVYAGTAFEETGPGPFTIGTTPIVFAPFSGSNKPYTFTWNTITGTSANMISNNGYFPDNTGLVTLLLPVTSLVGDEIAIAGQGSGGWTITQSASQYIHVGHSQTTAGIGGSLASTNQYDSLRLVCSVANTAWTCIGAPEGNITIV